MAHQIVIAWAEQTKLVPTGRTIRRDANCFPEFTCEWEGKAAMWLNRGTDADVEKAKRFAASEGHTVYTFAGAKDPLAKARDLAEKAAKAAA